MQSNPKFTQNTHITLNLAIGYTKSMGNWWLGNYE